MTKLALVQAIRRAMANPTRLSDYSVDRRMSKAFSVLDPGSAGNAAIANSEPRDIAPVWIGDNATRLDGALAGPDALDRNALFTSEASETGVVQSPDAIDRNLSVTVDERGDLPLHTYSGDDNAGPAVVQHIEMMAGDGNLQD